MGRRSKTKGANYERHVAKLMSDWWGGKFSRVPASGGLQWGSDQRVAGDIVPPPEADYPFVVECKKREGWSMEHILLDIGEPRKWWHQVVMDARRINKVPLLIFSRNRAKDFVMVPYDTELYQQLGEDVEFESGVTTVTIENIREETQIFQVIVTTFDAFSKFSKETLRDYAKRIEWDTYAESYTEDGEGTN